MASGKVVSRMLLTADVLIRLVVMTNELVPVSKVWWYQNFHFKNLIFMILRWSLCYVKLAAGPCLMEHLVALITQKICIALEGVDGNALLLAKEKNIWVWDLNKVNRLLGLYKKHKLVRK